MLSKEVFDAEEFKVSLRAYISFVSRKIKKNPNYNIHPIVRALSHAMENLQNSGKPGTYYGLSGDAKDNPEGVYTQLFFCVLAAHKDKMISIVEFYDLIESRPVPIKVLSYILVLAMKFDKFEGNQINIDHAIKAINSVIPILNCIKFNNNEWKEARDHFESVVEEYKVNAPVEHDEFKITANEFLKIPSNTPMEEYPLAISSTIEHNWVYHEYRELFKDNCINIVFSSRTNEYSKVDCLNHVLSVLYGAPSLYFTSQSEWKYFSDLRLNEVSYKRPSIKRNDPCPCNSSKKYKKCCGR